MCPCPQAARSIQAFTQMYLLLLSASLSSYIPRWNVQSYLPPFSYLLKSNLLKIRRWPQLLHGHTLTSFARKCPSFLRAPSRTLASTFVYMGFRANRFHSPAFRFWVRTCDFTKSGDVHLKFLLLPPMLALRWRVWCFSLSLNCLLFWACWCHRLNLDLSFINPDGFQLFSYQPPPAPDHILGLILMQTCLALQGLDFFLNNTTNHLIM